MTTRRDEVTFRVGADPTGVFRVLREVEERGKQVGRRLSNITGAIPGAGIVRRGIGAGTGAVGVVARGAGLQAGFAVFEQLFDKLFELLEGTPTLEAFTNGIQKILRAAAPLAGVLISALTPALDALEPLIEPLAMALAPLAELLGGALYAAITGLSIILPPVIEALEDATERFRDLLFSVLSRIPGVDISNFRRNTFSDVQSQLNATNQPDINVTAVTVLDSEVISRTVSVATQRNAELGG